MPDIMLYSFANNDRSGRVHWLLNELDLPYATRRLDYEKQEHLAPEFLALNPLGRVPTLRIGKDVWTESAAICVSLAERYEKFLPQESERPEFFKWTFFASSTLEDLLTKRFFAEQNHDDKKLEEVHSLRPRVQNVLHATLADQPFLLKSGFSVADILVGSCLIWGKNYLQTDSPILQKYYARLNERPACQKSGIFSNLT